MFQINAFILPSNTQIGDVHKSFVVTRIQGEKVFGVKREEVSQKDIDSYKAHYAISEEKRPFLFIPGRQIGVLNLNPFISKNQKDVSNKYRRQQ
jgi:hypothetical protein